MSKEGRSWGIDADPLEQPRLVLATQDHHGSGLSSLGFQSFLVSRPYMDLNQHSASARLLRPVAGPGLSVHRNSEDRGADAQSQRHAWSLLLFCSQVLRRPCWQCVCLSLDSPPCGVNPGPGSVTNMYDRDRSETPRLGCASDGSQSRRQNLRSWLWCQPVCLPPQQTGTFPEGRGCHQLVNQTPCLYLGALSDKEL